MPTFFCPCCEQTKSQQHFASHLASHESNINQYLLSKHDSYVTVKKGDRQEIYCCFGCMKTFATSTAASQHWKKGEDCRKKHRVFLFSIDALTDGQASNSHLQKENIRLRLENENLKEELSFSKRTSRENTLEKQVKYAQDWAIMVREHIAPWVMERLTPDEDKLMRKFWILEHNPASICTQHKPPSEVLKELKQLLSQSSLLQMLTIPTLESYCEAQERGLGYTTITMIPGMAFYNIPYMPPKYKYPDYTPFQRSAELPPEEKNESPPASEKDETDDENNYDSDRD